MVSPYFFLEKLTTFFSHRALWKVMTFLSCRLLTTPIFPRCLSSVLFKFSHKKNNFIQVSPLDGVTRGSSPALVTPLEASTFFAVMLVVVKREAVVTGALVAADRVLTDMLTAAIV